MIPCIRFAALLVAAASVVYHEVSAADHLRQPHKETEEILNGIRRAEVVPEYNQDIRGGFEIKDALPWYFVFADTSICGGALIYKDIAITAAHCVNGAFPNAIRVGSLTRSSGGTIAGVAQGVKHPSWTGSIVTGADIAVMKLSSSLVNEVATYNIDGNVPVADSNLFIAGFGLVNDDSLSSSLRGVFLDYVDQCSSRIGSYDSRYHICGDASPDEGTCAGDSGSPVFLAGTKTVVGLNSFSDNGCESQTVDVYTRVSTYSAWVAQQVCALSSDPPVECDEIDSDGGGGGGDSDSDSDSDNEDSGFGDCFAILATTFYNLMGWN